MAAAAAAAIAAADGFVADGMIAGGGSTPGFFILVAVGCGLAGCDATFAQDIFLGGAEEEEATPLLSPFFPPILRDSRLC